MKKMFFTSLAVLAMAAEEAAAAAVPRPLRPVERWKAMRSNRRKSIYGERGKLKKIPFILAVALLSFLPAGIAFAADTATDPLVPDAAHTIPLSKLSSAGPFVG